MNSRARKVEVETIVCTRPPSCRGDGWAFPPTIESLLLRELAGRSVVHFFGGKARFGTRMDIDPLTKPHVLGDAWLPPFKRSSFDVVILDPPYVKFSAQMTMALCCQAAFVAREKVVWFSTLWLDHPARLRLSKAYAVVVGRNAVMRCLQFFDVPANKMEPTRKFSRGPAIKYNRWLANPLHLPFGDPPAAGKTGRAA